MRKSDGKTKRPRLWAMAKLSPARRGRRRFNCDFQADWDERASAAVGLLSDHRATWARVAARPVTIGDFGAGNERLRPLLAAKLGVPHTYHPYDLHPQAPTTIRLDVVKGLPDRTFDIAICLGLLEYLPSIPAMATSLRRHCRFALISYVTADGPASIDHRAREERNWSTHATEAELRADFGAVGFELVAATRSDNEATSISLWGDG